MRDMAKSPFLQLFLLFVVVVAQFKTLYLKNKEFKSETLHTGRVL